MMGGDILIKEGREEGEDADPSLLDTTLFNWIRLCFFLTDCFFRCLSQVWSCWSVRVIVFIQVIFLSSKKILLSFLIFT